VIIHKRRDCQTHFQTNTYRGRGNLSTYSIEYTSAPVGIEFRTLIVSRYI